MENQEERQNDKFTIMTTQPVEKLVCSLALPTIISMLITAFYNMADTYFVARIGTSAAGAVGVVFSFMALIQAIGFFFGHGSGNYISRKLGAKHPEEAEEMAVTGFCTAFLAGVIIAVICFFVQVPLVKILGATDTITPYATEYLKYILLGAPFMMASLVLNNQLRFQGNAAYGMIGICTGAVLNIVLDPILIFGCRMGIAGAAIATTVSQFASMCILFYLCHKKGIVKMQFRNFHPCLGNYKEIVRGGLPSLFRQGIASVATICLNQFAGAYGDAAIAAMSIVSRVGMFAGSALIGFGQGFQPVCGFNYGAKKYERVIRAFSFCCKIASGALLLLGILGYVFARQIIGIFQTGDPLVMEIGISALRWQCLTFPLMGIIILCNMMLQTIGKALKASIVALARQGLFYIPALLILAPTLGLLGIKMAQPLSDLLAFILSVPLAISVVKEMSARSEMDQNGEKV